MKINKNYTLAGILPYVIIFLSSFLLLIPLLRSGFPITDDGTWMIIRLSAFYQSLREGQFPVRFLGRLNYNYGYPVANFLYPGFLYIGSIVHVMGFSFVNTVKIIMAASVVGAGICIYIWLKNQFSRISSLIATLGFLSSPYVLFDIYTRGSVGEILALFAASFVLMSLTWNNYLLASVAFGFLIISHNTLAIFFMFCLLIFAIVEKNWKIIRVIFEGLAISAFFWIPALSERSIVKFNSTVISDPSKYFAVGQNFNLVPILVGISLIICIIRSKQFFRNRRSLSIFLITSSSLFLSLSISYPFWHIGILSQIVQFPYRFLSISVLFGSWLIAFAVETTKVIHFYIVLAIILSILLIQAAPYVTHVRSVYYPEGYYTTNEATTTVGNEYMPLWVATVPETRPSEKFIIVEGSADISNQSITTQKIQATIHASQTSRIQMNTIYYPGWGITLNDVLVPIQFNNASGLMQFVVPQGTHTLRAEFRETSLRFSTDIISLFSLLIVCLSSLFKTRKQ